MNTRWIFSANIGVYKFSGLWWSSKVWLELLFCLPENTRMAVVQFAIHPWDILWLFDRAIIAFHFCLLVLMSKKFVRRYRIFLGKNYLEILITYGLYLFPRFSIMQTSPSFALNLVRLRTTAYFFVNIFVSEKQSYQFETSAIHKTFAVHDIFFCVSYVSNWYDCFVQFLNIHTPFKTYFKTSHRSFLCTVDLSLNSTV